MAFAVNINDETEVRINKLVQKAKLSKSDIVSQAISDKLEELEDYYLAKERLTKYDAKDNKTLTVVMAEYGMDN